MGAGSVGGDSGLDTGDWDLLDFGIELGIQT